MTIFLTLNQYRLNLSYNFFTIDSPNATAGPIPKANINVPRPTVPPRYQPMITTVISIDARIKEIG